MQCHSRIILKIYILKAVIQLRLSFENPTLILLLFVCTLSAGLYKLILIGITFILSEAELP